MGLPKTGGDQGGVLAPIHIGVLPLIDGVIRGGPAEQVIVWGVHGVFQCAGLPYAEGAEHGSQQKCAQFQAVISSP